MSSSSPKSLRASDRALHRTSREEPMAKLMFDPGAHMANDLVCLSHLRWSWVYQRPQHLMTRAARNRRVFVFEEVLDGVDHPRLDLSRPARNLSVATPRIPASLPPSERQRIQRELLDSWLSREGVRDFTLWFYTPMALPIAGHLDADCIVYDCMDELSGFAGAPPELGALERQLFSQCNIVFTGGHSLYEAKRRHHSQVHAVPSSVDVDHWIQARSQRDPKDQVSIPKPRLGYCGVIDERLDLGLIEAIAASHPRWQLVFVGPVTKIDPDALPQAPNIHYLGGRAYEDLPRYLSGWDVALLPFAHNESTRFISPTKLPEYLAAGRRVVSTAIRDVVRMFGDNGFIEIADGHGNFIAAIERCLERDDANRQQRVDRYLAMQSWDRTWDRMQALVSRASSAGAARGSLRHHYGLVNPTGVGAAHPPAP